jgi:hypothetical protein
MEKGNAADRRTKIVLLAKILPRDYHMGALVRAGWFINRSALLCFDQILNVP